MPKNPTFMGKMIEVDIYESGKHFMKGQPVSDAKVYTPSISKPLAKGQVSGLTEVSKRRFSLYLAGKTAAAEAQRFQTVFLLSFLAPSLCMHEALILPDRLNSELERCSFADAFSFAAPPAEGMSPSYF